MVVSPRFRPPRRPASPPPPFFSPYVQQHIHMRTQKKRGRAKDRRGTGLNRFERRRPAPATCEAARSGHAVVVISLFLSRSLSLAPLPLNPHIFLYSFALSPLSPCSARAVPHSDSPARARASRPQLCVIAPPLLSAPSPHPRPSSPNPTPATCQRLASIPALRRRKRAWRRRKQQRRWRQQRPRPRRRPWRRQQRRRRR